jgi:hypothetical protein
MLRPTCSLHRLKRHIFLEGSDGFVTSTAAPRATGRSDPVAGWELHPLKTNTFTRRTLGLTPRTFPKKAVAGTERMRGFCPQPAVKTSFHIAGPNSIAMLCTGACGTLDCCAWVADLGKPVEEALGRTNWSLSSATHVIIALRHCV